MLETEPAVEFRSARRPSAPIFSGNHPHTSTWGSCAQQFRGSAKTLHFRLPDSRV